MDMNAGLLLILAVQATSLLFMIYECVTAPEGYQDRAGFHCGKEA
jgi:hypothetical protein